MENHKQIAPKPYGISELYDMYGAMLFGYIFEIVKDRKLAEQYLITIFNKLPSHLDEINSDGINTWCLLQRMAKQQLSGIHSGEKSIVKTDGIDLTTNSTRNKFLNLMTEEQQQVFCRVYYHCKTTARVAVELNKSEESIRKTLKEVFAIIKKGA